MGKSAQAKSRTWLWLGLLLAAYAGLALWYGTWRPIDGDEGFYAYATRLVVEGQVMYRDFFYPQSPLLPFVYAPAIWAAGPSLRALRLESTLLSILMMVPWLLMLSRVFRERPRLLFGAILLLLLDPHLLIWNATVKTFVFCNLAASWGAWCLWRGFRRPAWGWFAAAGLAWGLAMAARSLYLPLPLVGLVGLGVGAARRGSRPAWLGVLAFAGGVMVANLPSLGFWLAEPDRFWFNNVTCHQIRFSELRAAGLGHSFLPRTGAALRELGAALVLNPYRLLLLSLTILGWIRLVRQRSADPSAWRRIQGLTAWTSAAFLLLNLVPDPVQHQYLTPTLGILMLPAASEGLAGLARLAKGLLLWLVPGVAGILFLLTLLFWRPGVSDNPDWSWAVYDRVCANLEAVTAPGDRVFSFWSGYVFETGTVALTGSENHFAVGVSEALSPAQKTRYRVVGKELLEEVFRGRRVQAVVVGAWMNEINHVLDDQQMTRLLRVFTQHYCAVASEGDISVCLPCDPATGRILSP